MYQYVFEGLRGEEEFVFRATSGPEIEMTLAVILNAEALDAWVLENRPLTEIERYGIAKVALMRALDDQAPESPRAAIRPSRAEVVAICRQLDL